MTVRLTLRDKEFTVNPGITIRQALKRVGIQPESVIPTREGELITDDEILKAGDHIQLISVISGGAF